MYKEEYGINLLAKLKDGIIGVFVKPDNSFWFLWVLWVISIIFIINDQLCKRLNIKQELGVCLIAVFLVLSMVVFEIRIFGFQFISYYFLFYSIGYYMNKYKDCFVYRNWVLLSLFIGWLFLASFWNMHELPVFLRSVTIIPQSILQYAYRFITALLAIYVLVIATPTVLNKENCLNKKMVHIGQISLGIYVTHLLLVIPISHRLCMLLQHCPIFLIIVISFILTMFLSVIFVEMLTKNKYTSKYLLGKL